MDLPSVARSGRSARAVGDVAKKRNKLPLHVRELLTAGELGDLFFNKGRSTIFAWRREELIPQPIMVAGCVFWRRAELNDWIIESCPNVRAWRWEPTRIPSQKRFLRLLKDLQAEAQAELSEIQDEILHLRRVRGEL